MRPKPTYEELLSENNSLKKKIKEFDSENDYKLFFENNEAIIIFVDPDNQNIIFANEAASRFYGYSREDFKKLKIFDIHTLSPDEVRLKMIEARNKKKNYFEFRHRLANGKIKDVEVYQTTLSLHDKVIFSIIIFDITEKKKAEAELKESESKYRDFIEKDISGFYKSTPEGKLLYCNYAFAKMLGYTIDELLNLPTQNLYPDKGIREDLLSSIIKNKNIFNKEVKLLTKTGRTIYCIENVVGKFNNSGNLTEFQGFIFDITKRKQNELALGESESRFKKLFEELGDAVFVTRVGEKNRGEILEANTAAVKQTGYSKKELLKMNIIDDIMVKGSNELSTEEGDNKLLNNDTLSTIEQKRRKDGTSYWTEVIVTPIDYKGVPASLSINPDITSRIEASKALEESEQKFRELFEKSGDAFLIIKNRNFIDCNEAAINMLNYDSKEDFINVHPSKLSPEYQPDGMLSLHKANEMMSMCIQKGTHRFEWDHKRKNGEVFPVEVLLTAITSDPHDETIHTVWRDITERKQNQVDLIIAKEKAEESDRLKSAFLANMSHEIRTPMNGILGFASLLKLPNLNKEQLSKYVSIIEKSGIRMLNIINDLMDISKIEAGQMEISMTSFDINEQLEYLYSFFLPEAEKENLILNYRLSLSGEKSIIYSDSEKIYAVLANLLKNAIKYCNKGKIFFGYEVKDRELIFYVRDTGMGIPADRQDAIFDRFVQADIEDSNAMEGAGLGLAISKAYIEMLDGRIWLESTEGKGTTFYFSIPHLVKRNNKLESIASNKVDHTGSKINKKLNILIADDEVFANTFLQIVVKDYANKIYTAANGEQAIDICKSNMDIDLILMDIKMPILNGYKATKRIREFNKDVIIIAQTAYALPGDNHKAIEAGCNDYLSKPIDKNKLISKIESIVNDV